MYVNDRHNLSFIDLECVSIRWRAPLARSLVLVALETFNMVMLDEL